MAKIPSLTLAGKLRYATAPAFLGAGGGLVGAAVGHDAASEKSKKKGRARDQAVRRGTLAGGLVGAGLLGGGAGVKSILRYGDNARTLRNYMKHVDAYSKGVADNAQRARREAIQEFDKWRPKSRRPADLDESVWQDLEKARFRDRASYAESSARRQRAFSLEDHHRRYLNEDIDRFRDGRNPLGASKSVKKAPEYIRSDGPYLNERAVTSVWKRLADEEAARLQRKLIEAKVPPMDIAQRLMQFRAGHFRPAMGDLGSSWRALKGDADRIFRQAQEDQARRSRAYGSGGYGSSGSGGRRWHSNNSSGSGYGGGGYRPPPPRSSVDVSELSRAFGFDLKGAKTKKEVKRAYRSWAAKNHPDRGGDTATFQKVQGMYDTYKNSPDFEKLAYLRELARLLRE